MMSKNPSLGPGARGENRIVKGILTKGSRNASRSAGTWILLCETAEGGLGFYGTAFGRDGLEELAASAMAVKQPAHHGVRRIQERQTIEKEG